MGMEELRDGRSGLGDDVGEGGKGGVGQGPRLGSRLAPSFPQLLP